MKSPPEAKVPTIAELRAVRGEMSQFPKWVFTGWQRGGENLLWVGHRVLCEVPMKMELERAASHAAAACNGLPVLLNEIDRLRGVLENVRAELGAGTTPHVAIRIIGSGLSESEGSNG